MSIPARACPAAAFLHHLIEEHDVADTESIFDADGHLGALFRYQLSGFLSYYNRNHTETWLQTVTMWIDRTRPFFMIGPVRNACPDNSDTITTATSLINR